MKWISIKDRLPIEYRRYLVYTDVGCQDCYDKKQHIHNKLYRGREYDICLWTKKNWSEGSGSTVTHWMELPISPLDSSHPENKGDAIV